MKPYFTSSIQYKLRSAIYGPRISVLAGQELAKVRAKEKARE